MSLPLCLPVRIVLRSELSVLSPQSRRRTGHSPVRHLFLCLFLCTVAT
ncbi:unnamed protein product [Callosobruchus maculatus]|uniref:Uncharacterized protein n=1 Tax=Callosobruchus maculatus TaxID=64391 RepID=A0A653D8P7_CALMS|nr:unnamed protein product [Callosobruchus maculatus]